MSKIGLIVQREYLTRVKKKSFIVMTFIGPLLTLLIYAVPVIMAMSGGKTKNIVVRDETKALAATLKSGEDVVYTTSTAPEEDLKKDMIAGKYDAVLVIPAITPDNTDGVKLISEKNLSLDLVGDIRKAIREELRAQKLRTSGISQEMLDKLEVKLNIDTKVIDEEGGKEKDSNSIGATIAGFVFALLIYMFIFLYGAMVMRGVIEEKTNRIVEVMVSSVKPFELMMGKVVGIALVGLTQFAAWVILSWGIGTAGMAVLTNMMNDKPEVVAAASNGTAANVGKAMENTANQAGAGVSVPKSAVKDPMKDSPVGKISDAIGSINFPLILGCFLFFFIGGYLLYGSLFAAIGSAVDNETDTQQFMLPITIPLIVGFMIASSAINDPESSVAVWASMIPFTSPIVMMVRIPFGVPAWQIATSMVLLAATFVGCIALAGRIYRVGVLMYGKKPTYKELGKWLFYKI